MTDLITMGKDAKSASYQLTRLSTKEKNEALLAIADELEIQADSVLAQNALDIEDGRSKGLSEAMLDRLLLTPERIAILAADTRRIAGLPDPVGQELESRMLLNGIRLSRRRIPIGVIGVIYEARPNVTIDVATLCLKTSNATILRGGSETRRSNIALVQVIQAALAKVDVVETAVQYIEDPDRNLVAQLLRLDQYVDMIIPRGGSSLHKLCREHSSIPVITGGIGICHIYVDETADLDRAVDIIENAKVQRPSVCNALDTLLLHPMIAEKLLPPLLKRLGQHGVEIRVTSEAYELLKYYAEDHEAKVVLASAGDFDQEWLGLTMGIQLVGDLDEAIAHIHRHSTEHTDAILTTNLEHATRFVNEVNSAAVFVNASTRFNDGGQFGLGAEVAVSTQKLHARGPMGLEELTTYKWVGYGDGQIRD
ncbi:MAG: glutamate-5-semialdehyde dehydrogenase [Ardenticatenaceae bacterium]|nr:glutamate-5-semialdehyde dehydrogenase [Ardenticatenaceae bacterium]